MVQSKMCHKSRKNTYSCSSQPTGASHYEEFSDRHRFRRLDDDDANAGRRNGCRRLGIVDVVIGHVIVVVFVIVRAGYFAILWLR